MLSKKAMSVGILVTLVLAAILIIIFTMQMVTGKGFFFDLLYNIPTSIN